MSAGDATRQRRVTVRGLREMKRRGEPIAALTAYDYLFARLVDRGGADLILVGDSMAQVVLGYESTLPVTLDAMIHHGSAVMRGVERAFVVIDMPFLSFQVSVEETVRNAGRIMKETGAQAVKMEQGDEVTARHVRAVVRAGIPVLGHIGLTPQSVHALGGYRVQGREAPEAERLKEEARRLADAGCLGIVLELVPAALAEEISDEIDIPTIGIGAGPGCDGQVLVLPDMLGLNDEFEPRFLRRFAALADAARDGIADYIDAVRDGEYPGPEHSFE